jgi:hypothetical protein
MIRMEWNEVEKLKKRNYEIMSLRVSIARLGIFKNVQSVECIIYNLSSSMPAIATVPKLVFVIEGSLSTEIDFLMEGS